MNSIKILHCADMHIDAANIALGTVADSRKFETLITFENIIDLAAQNNIDMIAIAGDLFDTPTPQSNFVSGVLNKIATVPNIKVIYCGGNHDPLNANSPFLNNELPQNLFVLPTKDTCITFEDIKTRVYGRSFETTHLDGEETFSLTVPDDDYINIMVQHGELKSDLNSDYNAITPRFIKYSGMDYIALGHVHKSTPIGKIHKTSFAYPGCPEGHGFDELDEKGVYLGEISKENVNLTFVPVAKRKYIHHKTDITNVTDIPTVILEELKSSYQNFADNFYKIELTGTIPEDSELNITEITTRLSNNLYFVKVKDSTEYQINLEALAKETSLKGVFVKNMLKKMAEADDKKLIKKALNIGLKAFSSEVKYNED